MASQRNERKGKAVLTPPKQARHTRQKKSTKPPVVHEPEPVIAPGATAYRSFATMPIDACRWPENDPRTDGYHMCGKKIEVRGNAYCADHMEQAFRKEKDRKKRDR